MKRDLPRLVSRINGLRTQRGVAAHVGKAVEPQVIGEHIRRLRLKLDTFRCARSPHRPLFPELHLPARERPGFSLPPGIHAEESPRHWAGTLGKFFAATASDDESLVVRMADRRRLEQHLTDAPPRSARPIGEEPETGAGARDLRSRRKSRKHAHANPHEEFAFVVKGQATLSFADEAHTLEPGDAVTLPLTHPTAGRTVPRGSSRS